MRSVNYLLLLDRIERLEAAQVHAPSRDGWRSRNGVIQFVGGDNLKFDAGFHDGYGAIARDEIDAIVDVDRRRVVGAPVDGTLVVFLACLGVQTMEDPRFPADID